MGEGSRVAATATDAIQVLHFWLSRTDAPLRFRRRAVPIGNDGGAACSCNARPRTANMISLLVYGDKSAGLRLTPGQKQALVRLRCSPHSDASNSDKRTDGEMRLALGGK
jgi:hypothetical protein